MGARSSKKQVCLPVRRGALCGGMTAGEISAMPIEDQAGGMTIDFIDIHHLEFVHKIETLVFRLRYQGVTLSRRSACEVLKTAVPPRRDEDFGAEHDAARRLSRRHDIGF